MQRRELAAGEATDIDYQRLAFDYVRHADQDAATARRPVVVVGAGPVGLALAIDLAQRGVPVVLIDNDNTLSTGSRAICFAKRTLEIFDRLGCGQRMVDKGVSWNVGRVFFENDQIYSFDLLPEAGHARPAFINLQQYYVEGFLAKHAGALPGIDLRWNHSVAGVAQHADHVTLTIDTPEGSYRLDADYVAACNGGRSAMRQLMGLASKGAPVQGPLSHRRREVEDGPSGRALVLVRSLLPSQPERAAAHATRQRLAHRLPARLGRRPGSGEAAREDHPTREGPARRGRPVRARMGACLHLFVPAPGALPPGPRVLRRRLHAWRVAIRRARRELRRAGRGEPRVEARGGARRPGADALLDSYGTERKYAVDENILNSTRATDFITPKSTVSRLLRDAVLELTKRHTFARVLVNSGRLSVPATLRGSALNTTDGDGLQGHLVPGAVAADAPIAEVDGTPSWLLRQTAPTGFTAFVFGTDEAARRAAHAAREAGDRADMLIAVVQIPLDEAHALAAQRYDARPGTVYLLRPDQHVCARWRQHDASAICGARAVRKQHS